MTEQGKAMEKLKARSRVCRETEVVDNPDSSLSDAPSGK